MTLGLVFIASVYARGWLRMRSTSAQTEAGWRAAGFLLGLLLIWIAVASALASGDTHLLTIHMVQHLLLMSNEPRWWVVLYLFLATLPCDVLSGFLVFSERVAYPVYLSMHRHSSLSVLNDQQYAGALMWTTVTIIYVVAGMIVTTQLLSSRPLVKHLRTV